MEVGAVAAVATGRESGCLALTIDVDADDGSFVVVLVDMSPDLPLTLSLIVGLVDAQLLELDASLSSSWTSFSLFRELVLDGIMN